jgi:hypothetical protein
VPARHREGRRPGRPRALTIAAVVCAVAALLVGGTVLVRAARTANSTPTPVPDATGKAAPPVVVVPPLPPPPGPDARAPRKAKDRAAAAERRAAPADQNGGAGVPTLANCTKRVGSGAALTQALSSASAGQKICAVGDMGGTRLTISRSGTPANPITVVGDGTNVKGITVKASNVVVAGFNAVGAKAPGIELTGSNITVRNNTVKHPTGGDYDGLRFFGNNLKILNNTITDISPDGSGAHADCMQTFASDTPASQNVLISGNKCLRIDNQCLIAEGPNDGEGDGRGHTNHITFVDNVCQANAAQALMIEDVQHMVVKNNSISGSVAKAFAFDIGSTGATVSGNKIAKGIGYQVGMDSSSRGGYSGPAIGGGP